MHIDLGGRVALDLINPDPRTARYLERQNRGFVTADPPSTGHGATARVVLERLSEPLKPLVELQGPAGDDETTGTDGERFWVVRHGLRCSIPDATVDERPAFSFEPGFPVESIYRSAIRPAIQIAAARGGAAAAVHAASVTIDGRAILVAGWSESGKTETALALMERGAAFLSDKWTLLGPEGESSGFPITIGIRRWVLDDLPTLAAAQTPQSRVQFAAAWGADLATRPMAAIGRRLPPVAPLTTALVKAARLADRSAYEASDLRSAYGQSDDPTRRVATAALVLLETVPDGPVSVREDDGDGSTVVRLARSAAYERRRYLDLVSRSGYVLPDRPGDVHARAVELDAEVLRQALPRIRVLRVRAPFPTDPRVAADAILEAI